MSDRTNILEAREIPGSQVPAIIPEPSQSEYEPYFHDESKLESKSLSSLAFPRTTEEVAGILTEHAKQRHLVNFSGARTGVVGGFVTGQPVHLVSLERLQGVVSVDTVKQTAKIRSGTALRTVNEYLAEHHPGLFFPVDPTETSASVGGLVSTNAGGARSFAFGSIRKWVTGLEVVLADGAVLALRRGEKHAVDGEIVLETAMGSRSFRGEAIPKPETKNSIGYSYGAEVDPIDIFIGAEGTLGAVAEVELKLLPRFESCLYMIQFFQTAEQALKFVLEIRRHLRDEALAVEFLDTRSIDLVRRAGKCGAFEKLVEKAHGGAVYSEFRLDDDDALERITERLDADVTACGGSQEHSMAGMTDAELREIKRFRHAVPEQANVIIAQRRKEHGAIHKLSTDMAVPEPDLEWVYNLYRSTLEREGVEYLIFGHAGNSHLHMNMLPRNPAELEKAKAIYLELAEKIVARGGAVAAEHGIGRIKKEFLKVQYSGAHLDTMRGIKSFFDPEWRLSPGILIDP